MKKVFAFSILSAAFLFNSCDYVDVPQQAITTTTTSDTVRKVLVEDFTGHTCINCPDAARLIDSLETVFPGQIIPMAIHSGFFAEPCPPHSLPMGAPPGSFSEDFTVPLEDADYNSIFGIDSWPNPNGMINRYGAYPSQTPTAASVWPDSVAFILQDSLSAYIKIHPSYSSSSRQLHLTVSGILYDTLVGNYNIAIYLVENNIQGWQLDDNIAAPSIDSTYIFNHVFRGCVNNPGHVDGLQVLSGTSNRGTLINYNMSTTYTLNAAYNESNCKLVGILYDAATYKVVQADMVDLM